MRDAPDRPSDTTTESIRELVLLDLAHRIKNIYAVIDGVLALSVRASPEARPFITPIRARIAALEAAHAYLIEAPPQQAAALEKHTAMGLLAVLIAPFKAGGVVTIGGEDAAMNWRAGATLALIVRELSTNSVKYGALSADEGRIEIACREEGGRYVILWSEKGGPRIAGPPARQGSGTLIIDRAAALTGFSVTRQWEPDGLNVALAIPLKALEQ